MKSIRKYVPPGDIIKIIFIIVIYAMGMLLVNHYRAHNIWNYKLALSILLMFISIYLLSFISYRRYFGLGVGPISAGCLSWIITISTITFIWIMRGRNVFLESLLLGIIGLPLSLILRFLLYEFIFPFENNRYQRQRSHHAEVILDNIKQGKTERFFLFLRPFKADNRQPMMLNSYWSETPGFRVDLESALERAGAPCAPLLALGRPIDATGAGRILTDDENWQQKVITLVEEAILIFVIPSWRPGTFFEIDLLYSQNYLHKCIFIMPGHLELPIFQPDFAYNAEEWDKTREALASMHINLPLYNDEGMFFTLSSNGQVAETFPINLQMNLLAIPQIRDTIFAARGNILAQAGILSC